MNLLGRGYLADFGLGRRGRFRDLQVTGTAARAGTKRIQPGIVQEHVACLGNKYALPGELLLDAHRATKGANTHDRGCVESYEHVLRIVANGHGLSLNLGRIDRKRGLMLDVRVNRAGIEGNGERAAGFQDGKMRRAADGNLTAFDQVDPRSAGFDSDIAAAAQNCFHLPVHHFYAHGAANGDGFALDDANRLRRWLIRTRPSGAKKTHAEKKASRDGCS